MSAWLPIKTADKTPGNRILCYGEGTVFEAECDSDDGDRCWCSIGGLIPTHWMPLPDPPTRNPHYAPAISSIILKRKHWRAKYGEPYFFVDSELNAHRTREDLLPMDYRRHEVGNYFETEGEAEAMAEKFRAILKKEDF